MGMPGVGKTTLGRQLSKELQLPFYDLDKEIEKISGQSIPEIFKNQGEDFFRQKERDVLAALLKTTPAVIALGGGTPVFYDNMSLIKQHAFSIYIRTSLKVISDRLNKSKTKRPLLQGKTPQEFDNHLKSIYENRKIFFEQADIVINIGQTPPKKNLPKLLEAWADFNE